MYELPLSNEQLKIQKAKSLLKEALEVIYTEDENMEYFQLSLRIRIFLKETEV